MTTYFVLCLIWCMYILFRAERVVYKMYGWRFVVSCVFLPGTLASIVIGMLFIAFDDSVDKIFNCLKR